uniref:Organic cation transporter protein-like n=1 Tax=Phallusia mammillata TaxID=59560 RepID=A0A6F9DSZ9_9ASCI|nr:organic cation transporter protein-like [Phallusia mammillata]
MIHIWKSLTRYERRLCILLLISAVTNPFSALATLIFHYTPEYHCNVTAQINTVTSKHFQMFNRTYNSTEITLLNEYLIPEETDALGRSALSHCHAYNRTKQQLVDFASYNTPGSFRSNVTAQNVKCSSTTFFFEKGVESAVREFDMVCDNAWKKPMALISYMIGKFAGTYSSGWFSDKFGRRINFLVFTFVQTIAMIIMAFANSYNMYVALFVVIGFSGVGNYGGAIVLGSETVKKEHRNFVCTFIAVGFSIGYMILPLIGYLCGNWRWFSLVSGLMGLIYIPYIWLIDETPSWLTASGKAKQARKVLQKIANYNKQNDYVFDKNETDKTSKTKKISILNAWWLLIKTPKLLFRLMITCSVWFVCNMSYYAIAFDTNSLSGSRFLNCFYAGVVELAGYLISYFTVEKGGRKYTVIGFMTIAGIATVASPFTRLWSNVATTLFTMCAKLSVAVGYHVVYLSTPEMFPTAIRHSSLATSSTFGRLGGVLAPVIIFTGKGGTNYPTYVASGALTLIISALFILTPDTHNRKLPETVEEAVNMTLNLPCSVNDSISDQELKELNENSESKKLQATI